MKGQQSGKNLIPYMRYKLGSTVYSVCFKLLDLFKLTCEAIEPGN